MELRRIVGPDVKTALRLVREQLGPDAMILSNRRVAGGIEIVAAPETQPGAAAAPATRTATAGVAPERGAVPLLVEALASVAAPPAGAAVPAEGSPLRELQSEMRSMRALLDQSLAEIRCVRTAFGPGVEGRIWRRLTRLGVPNELVSELVAQVPAMAACEDAWSLTLARLAAGIGTAGDPIAQGGVWACAGPTGAGKTTTVCKLAVRHALAHGAQGLALISMDGTRIGGADMLRTVARLLGVPFHAARAGDSLQDLLREVRDAELVLVDTAGVSRRSAEAVQRIAELGELAGRVGTLLVLPATAQYACLDAAVRDYAACRPVAAVVTRLDEALSLGEIVGVLTRERLPLAYTSDGPDIPEDLRVAGGGELVAHATMLDPDGESTLEETRAALATSRIAAVAEAADAARIAG